ITRSQGRCLFGEEVGMIKITRSAKPPLLNRKAEQWRDEFLNARRKKDRARAEAKYHHSEIKDALIALFHGKCAYCESFIRNVDYGHIEHFRPKSIYPKLTFEWTNLLLACGICNGAEHKGDKFPDPAAGGPLVNP